MVDRSGEKWPLNRLAHETKFVGVVQTGLNTEHYLRRHRRSPANKGAYHRLPFSHGRKHPPTL